MTVQQIIHLRYNDVKSLQEELTKLFPDGDFAVNVQMGQFILTLPRGLSQTEVDTINSKQRHYQRPSDAGRKEK